MTVASATAKAGPYTGDGSTDDFDFSFKVQAAADVKVVSTVTTDGVQIDTTLTLTTHYTILLNADQGASPGGTVTINTPPASSVKITILRNVTATQGASLPNQGGFYPKVIENALDKQAMLVQQQQEELDRCLKLSVADSITNLQDLLTTVSSSASAASSSASSASSSASTATTQAGIATTKAGLTAADAISTAADRVQTGLDVIDTAADRVQTGLDAIATAADRVQTGLDAIATGADAVSTAADAIATAADRVQTGLDRVATGQDVIAAAASAASAAAIANAFIGTSTTSWTPAVESKAFTTQAGELYTTGIYVTVVSAAAPTAYGWGQVTSYSGTTLTVDVQLAAGSGSHTDWNISLAGVRGATGATGAGLTAQAVGFTATLGTTPKTLTVDVDITASLLALASQLSIGLQTCWIPAGAMVARTTNGAASGTTEMATTYNMFKTLDFDTATAEYAQFCIQMPKSWNEGTVTAAFVWSHAATTTNFGVAFGLQGVAISNDDTGAVAFGTAQLAVDTGGTTNDIYITPATSAITIGGTPAANDYVMFQVYRAVSDGGDTMAIDARLHGVQLYYTIDAATDA